MYPKVPFSYQYVSGIPDIIKVLEVISVSSLSSLIPKLTLKCLIMAIPKGRKSMTRTT